MPSYPPLSPTVQHGFLLEQTSPLPELNATLLQLRHVRTGARMVHIECDDPNALFAIGFRTPPRDSTGIAHILEHTVLCGSQRYPVRDPFFSMLKRSLNTFMNAMTASDWTFYPFATQNKQDFKNLLAIYLDAVFFPLLREEDFRQEGHRLEFVVPEDPGTPLIRRGIVYNEMQGAMASPPSLLARRLAKALYPSTTYRFNSGGEPAEIPQLTWEALRAFHVDYYHPSNAWLYSYGRLDLDELLEQLDSLALGHFESRSIDSTVHLEQQLDAPRQVVERYPLDSAEPQQNKTFVQLAWLTCDVTDSFERLSLSVLSSLLLGNPAAPLYRALLESRIGENLCPGSGYQDDNRTTYFAVGLQGTEAEHREKIEQLVLTTLEDVADNGFSAERIEGVLHRLEFEYREVTGNGYPYALTLLFRMLGPWLHGDNPLTALGIGENLARLRREIAAGPYMQQLIRRYLLDNPQRVTLVLAPDSNLRAQQEQEEAVRLGALRQQLDPTAAHALVQSAMALQHSQNQAPDLSLLPTLTRGDIPRDEKAVSSLFYLPEYGNLFWFDQPTNGIGYFTAHLPIASLASELRPCLPLFAALLTQVGAAGESYVTMAERIEAGTGGVQAGVEILESLTESARFQGVFELRGKALVRKQSSLFEVLRDLSCAADFHDLDRLRTVLGQIRSSLENSLVSSGHSYAARSASACLTAAGRQRNEWTGIPLLRLVRRLTDASPGELQVFSSQLSLIVRHLFSSEHIRCGVSVEASAFATIAPALEGYLQALPASGTGEGVTPSAVPFIPTPARRGWVCSTPVNFVTRVFATVPFSHVDSAPLTVLARLLRSGYLHREIREKGGAYGGLASYDADGGLFSLLSYRDPHVARTLQVYDEAIDWAVTGTFGDTDIDEALLSVFADLDRPLSPGSRGLREFVNLEQGLTPALRMDYRSRLLAVDRRQLLHVAETYLGKGRYQSAIAVIGSEEALLHANQELGEQALCIERI